MDPDGTVHELTATPDIHEGVAVASPDGSMIAFVESTWDPFGDYSIAVMDIDGTDRRTLLHLGANLSWPAWSPDRTEAPLWPGAAGGAPGRHDAGRSRASAAVVEGADWAALPGTVVAPAAGGTVAPAAWTGIRALALPDPSTKQLAAMSATSIWPTRDGYRDTVKVRQKLREPARSRIDVYSQSGSLVRRVRFGFTTGVFSTRGTAARHRGRSCPPAATASSPSPSTSRQRAPADAVRPPVPRVALAVRRLSCGTVRRGMPSGFASRSSAREQRVRDVLERHGAQEAPDGRRADPRVPALVDAGHGPPCIIDQLTATPVG